MESKALNILRPSTVISDNLDMLIDAFVDYYGEEKREFITQRFRSAVILKLCENRILSMVTMQAEKQLAEEFFGPEDPKEFPVSPSELYDSLTSEVFHFCYVNKSVKKLFTGREDITDEEFYEGYKKGLFPKAEEFVREFEPYKIELDFYKQEYSDNMDRQFDVSKKYYKMLVDEFRYLVPDEEYEEYLKTGEPTSMMISFFNSDIRMDANCFDEEAESSLNNPEYPDIFKSSIKEDRTNMAYAMYLRNPSNPRRIIQYEDFINNPELNVYMEEAKKEYLKIYEKRKEIAATLPVAKLQATADYQRNAKLIEGLDFVNKNHDFGLRGYMSWASSCSINYIRTENGLEYKPMIILFAGSGCPDMSLIHELNHLYEDYIIEADETYIKYISGWDILEGGFADTQDNSDTDYYGITRPYEYLSEFINQRIIEEITERMFSKGNYIFFPHNKGEVYYLAVKPFFDEFFQTYKTDIIKSRSNNNIGHLFDAIGKENFEELNSIANDFFKKFGFDENKLVNAYLEKVQGNLELDDNDKEIAKLFERKDKVMQAILEYRKGREM